jgi:hypothetical protein
MSAIQPASRCAWSRICSVYQNHFGAISLQSSRRMVYGVPASQAGQEVG